MEVQAGSFEGNAEVVQHRANLRFGVIDEVLIDHPESSARLHRVEMAHEPPIVSVKTTDGLEAVREPHAGGVILFEVGKTASHRMAPRVDDARVGKSDPNQREVDPVSRKLVDEERLLRPSEGPRALKIFPAHVAKL